MSESKKLTTPYKYLILDCYGTLVDWETGIYEALKPLLASSPTASQWSRKEALQAFGSVELNLQTQHPEMLYIDLLARVHEALSLRLMAAEGKDIPATSLDERSSSGDPSTSSTTPELIDPHRIFANSITHWPIFPDTIEALRRLSRSYKLIILSNVDKKSFETTDARLSQSGQSPFSLIVTAEETKAYKPSVVGFNFVLERIKSLFGETDPVKDKVLSVAQSLRHDHVPARQLGMDSVWIDRKGACMGVDVEAQWKWRFETLAEMADAVEKELGQ